MVIVDAAGVCLPDSRITSSQYTPHDFRSIAALSCLKFPAGVLPKFPYSVVCHVPFQLPHGKILCLLSGIDTQPTRFVREMLIARNHEGQLLPRVRIANA